MKLSRQEKERLVNKIQNFFYEERGEEIGIIAAEEVLEFVLEDLGSIIYNRALDDAKIWFLKKIEDMQIDYDLIYRQERRGMR